MLKMIKIKDPSTRWSLLSELNPQTDCFIVSDIKTKLSVESELLVKHNFLPGFCVMRAGEFYRELFSSLDLNWNITSDFFVKELFSEFCSQYKKPWIKNLQNSKSFFKFFNIFFTVLSHKEKSDLFAEWFGSQSYPVLWKPWFNLCQEFFIFLESKKTLHESGLKALLLNQLPPLNQVSFKRERIFVDLGFSFDLCEKDIFKELSRHKEIHILSPELKDKQFFEETFNSYQNLEEELSTNEKVFLSPYFQKKSDDKPITETQFFKIKNETQIEEIQKAVTQVCKWLKAGVSSTDIAIFAPDMENYWFALKIYFDKENIPVKKSVFAQAGDFSEIKYFLSALHIHLGYFSFEDLEYFSFFKESKRDFSQFKVRYFNVPERELVKKLLFKGKNQSPNENITGRQFFEWVLSFWPKTAPNSLWETVFKAFLNYPLEEKLKASAWMRLLESELSSLEVEIEGEDQRGISCLSFNALHSLKSSYVFVMGLDEESLKTPYLNILKESDRKHILNDLGFSLPLENPKEKENSLLWFLQSSWHKEVYLSFSSYDFKGDIKTPALLYFLSESLFSSKNAEITEKLAWDNQKKQNDIDKILISHLDSKEKVLNLKQSLQNKEQPFFHKEKIQLSPNSLKTYIECPFKYAAKKLFFVKEENPVEQELSALSRGSIVHELFEACLKQHPDLYLDQEEIERLIEQLKPIDEKLIYKRQWILVKEELKSLLNSFLEKERMDRNRFPGLKPKSFETKVSAYWNQEKGELESSGKYAFKAFIDRIDWDEETGSYIIRDYKASNIGLTHISSWVKEDQEEYQLTFYAQALQKGLVNNLPAGKISALFYSAYKKDFSTKGFVEKTSSLEKIMGENLKGHNKSEEFLHQAITDTNKQTQALVQQMEKGYFAPKPKKKDICRSCLYQTWCRVETIEENLDFSVKNVNN